MAIGMVVGLSLLAGILLILYGLIKGGKKQMVALLGLGVLVFGLFGALGYIDLGGMAKPSQQSFTTTVVTSEAAATTDCRARGLTSDANGRIGVLYKNVENSTGDGYIAATFSTNNNLGQRVDGSTTNAGASGTAYVVLSNTPLCTKGSLVATITTGTGVASSRKVTDVSRGIDSNEYNLIDDASKQYIIKGASLDVVSVLARTTAFAEYSSYSANGSVGDEVAAQTAPSVSGTGTADGTAFVSNTSVLAKGSVNFYVDLTVNGTTAVFGSFDELDGTLVSYDSGTAAKFSSSSLDLQSDTAGWALTKLGTCPNDVKDNRNVEACWSAPTMKSGKLYRVKGTITADGGDPLVSDTMPRIFFDDKVIFRDVDGIVKYQFYSSSGGTNQGVGGTELRFNFN